MKFIFILTGKTNQQVFDKIIAEYLGRLKHYINYEMIVIPEVKNAKNISIAEQKEREADSIIKHIDNQDDVILLDEKGKQFSSVKFAEFIDKKCMSTYKRIVFVVGGPFGFSNRIYERANGLISMSAMTFSHQMIRLIFFEQLYRAMTIIKGEKYHHE